LGKAENWTHQRRSESGRLTQATYKVILEENMLHSALTMFPNLNNSIISRQCSNPHSQANKGVVGGPTDLYY